MWNGKNKCSDELNRVIMIYIKHVQNGTAKDTSGNNEIICH